MFRAYLRVSSDVHSPEFLTQRLGVEPDGTRWKGAVIAARRPPARTNEWRRMVLEGLSQPAFGSLAESICGWGLEFAERLGVLARANEAIIEVCVVQEFIGSGDAAAKGIELSAGLIEWASMAGASIDIDQYIYEPGATALNADGF